MRAHEGGQVLTELASPVICLPHATTLTCTPIHARTLIKARANIRTDTYEYTNANTPKHTHYIITQELVQQLLDHQRERLRLLLNPEPTTSQVCVCMRVCVRVC